MGALQLGSDVLFALTRCHYGVDNACWKAAVRHRLRCWALHSRLEISL